MVTILKTKSLPIFAWDRVRETERYAVILVFQASVIPLSEKQQYPLSIIFEYLILSQY